MAIVPFPPGAHAFIEFTLGGRPGKGWALDFSWEGPSAVAPGDLGDLGAVLTAELLSPLQPNLATSLTFTRIILTATGTGLLPFLDWTSGLPITGTGSTASTTPQVCLCLKKSTGFSGRAYRGRVYVPALPEGAVDNTGLISGTAYDNIKGIWSDIVSTISSTTDWRLAVASRFLDGAARTLGVYTPVQEIFPVDNYVDTQRRRLKG